MNQLAVRKGMIMLTVFVILAIFVFIMTSGGLLKQSFSESDNVEKYLDQLDKIILDEQWHKSMAVYNNLYKAWYEVERRVQFSIERRDIMDIRLSLDRLKGCIKVKSRDDAIINITEIKSLWKYLEE